MELISNSFRTPLQEEGEQIKEGNYNNNIDEMIHSSSTNDIYLIHQQQQQQQQLQNQQNDFNRSNSTGSQNLPQVMLMQSSITMMMGSNSSSASGSGSLSPSSSVQNFSLLNDIYFHNSNNVNEVLSRHGTSFSYSSPSSSHHHHHNNNNSANNNSNSTTSSSIVGNSNKTPDMGSINMGFANMTTFGGDRAPKYDLELIVQTTKQEDARFMGKKKRRNSSVSKVFLGDFLKLSSNVTILKMISKYGDNHILFSDVLVKVNKRNKMQERIIIITDKSIYNVHPDDYKLKRRISLENLTSLSMSTLEDNFIIIHVNTEYDYVLISNRKIEIATTLVEAYYKLTFYQISPLTIQTTTTTTTTTPSPLLLSSPLSISLPSPTLPTNITNGNNNNNNSNNTNTSGSAGSNGSSPYPSPNSLFSVNHNTSNIPSPTIVSSSYQSPLLPLPTTATPTSGATNNNNNNNNKGKPQFLRSHSQSQLPPNLNISSSTHSPSNISNNNGGGSSGGNLNSNNSSVQNSPQMNNIFLPNISNVNSTNNIIIINNNNQSQTTTTSNSNNNSNNNNNNNANIVQRITGSILPVDFNDRIEFKTESDTARELIFNRVQGAVNIIIQTVKKTSNNKKDNTRVSIR